MVALCHALQGLSMPVQRALALVSDMYPLACR
jgi:hypothetical protein